MGVRRNFSRGCNVNILLIFVRLLTMQCKRKFTKRFTFSPRLRHKENAPCYDNSHKRRFVGSHSQVYYDNFHNRPWVANLLQDMRQVFSNASTNASYHRLFLATMLLYFTSFVICLVILLNANGISTKAAISVTFTYSLMRLLSLLWFQ